MDHNFEHLPLPLVLSGKPKLRVEYIHLIEQIKIEPTALFMVEI